MTARKTKSEAAPAAAQLIRDPVSFQGPLQRARARCTSVLTTMATRVRNTEARLHVAMAEYEALETFDELLRAHVENASFRELPGIRSWGRRMAGFYQLRAGPFRGVFLLGKDSKAVVALVFSRQPHDSKKRVRELAAQYRDFDKPAEKPE